MRRALGLLAVLVVSGLVSAQDAAAPAGPVVRSSSQQRFTASGSLAPGAEYHLIWEDPATHAVQTLVRVPNGYQIPPHSHSRNETMLVLRGRLRLDFGTRVETMKAGDYALIPSDTPFALKAEGWGGMQFLMTLDGPYDSKPAELPK